ncbi:hypothetical protein SDJN02_26942, partial [Cucurbita argyrosperma subsp. argyrosperma]
MGFLERPTFYFLHAPIGYESKMTTEKASSRDHQQWLTCWVLHHIMDSGYKVGVVGFGSSEEGPKYDFGEEKKEKEEVEDDDENEDKKIFRA